MTQARFAGLQALVEARVARAGGRVGVVVSGFIGVALALAMVILRYADGPSAFLEGVVARAVTTHLVLVSLPFALGVARLGRVWPGEAGLVALAAQRGLTEADVAAVIPGAAMRVAVRRVALTCAPLAALAAVCAFPEEPAALRRLVAVSLLVLLGCLSAAGLAALAAVFASRARRAGGVFLTALFVVPWLVALTVPAVPAYASLPGAYEALRALILAASSK